MVRKKNDLLTRESDFLWIGGLIFAVTALLWGGVMFGQTIAKTTSRWMLFLVPDELVDTWIDGPVTAQGWLDRLCISGVAIAVLGVAAVGGSLCLGSFDFRHLLGMGGQGSAALRRHHPFFGALRRGERWSLALAIGLGIQAQILLLMGLLGMLNHAAAPWIVVGLVWIAGLVMGRLLRCCEGRFEELKPEELKSEELKVSEPIEKGSAVRVWLPRSIAILFVAILMLRAGMPPAEYDVREYHLQAAKEWWQGGAIEFMPHNIYANMPMGAESQSLLAMMIWNDIGAGTSAWWWGALSGKLVIASYAVLMALLVGGVVRLQVLHMGIAKEGAEQVARWTRVIVLSFPAVMEGASIGLIEAAVATYLAAGLLITTSFRFFPQESKGSWLPALCGWCGLLSGIAMACKYTALVLMVPPLALSMLWSCGDASNFRTQAAREIICGRSKIGMGMLGVLLLCGGFLGGGLWYLKNYLLAGNPVYPLAGLWLGGTTLDAEKIAQWNRAHQTPAYAIQAMIDSMAQLLWRWRLQDWSVVPLCVVALFCGWKQPVVRFYLMTALVVVVIWWSITHRVERFLIPASPVLFVLAGLGIAQLSQLWSRRAVAILMTVFAIIHAVYDSGPVLGDARILVDPRYLRVDDLTASSITRLSPHVIWVQQNLSPLDRLLVVGDAAVFDYEVPLDYSTTFDRSVLRDVIDAPSEDQKSILEARGITHVLVHWAEIQRLRSTYGFDETIDRESLGRLEQTGVLRAIHEGRNGAYTVWMVRQ